MDKLEATGAFENVLTANSERTDDGLHRATIRSQYVGSVAEPETTAAAPAISSPPARGEGTASPATPPAAQPQRGGGRQ